MWATNEELEARVEALIAQTQRIARNHPPRRAARPAAPPWSATADEQAARANTLIAEVHRTLASDRRRRDGRQAARRPQETPEYYAYCLADLRSTRDGRRLGKQFSHNPFALARRLGVTLEHVPLRVLQNSSRPTITILGRLARFPGHPLVQLADGLAGRELQKVLAHELAHLLDSGFDERLADQFADEFLKVADDEIRGYQWRQIQRQQLETARRRSRR